MSQPILPTEPIRPDPDESGVPTEPLEPTGSMEGPETEVLPGSPRQPAGPGGPPGAPRPPGGGHADEARRRRILIAAIVAVVALIVGVVAVILWQGDDGDETTTGSTTTSAPTTVAPSSTTTPSTVTTTAPSTAPTTAPTTATTLPAPAPVDTSTAVFPFASSSTRYDDPIEAARGFAVDFVGFTNPVVGEFMQGDTRSGEVEIRPMANGPATTVFVRQLGPDDSWWVLGSATGNIDVDEPDAGDRISSPVPVRGRALAFEGTVAVEVRADGRSRPIGTGIVTGGGDQMRPFEGEISFPTPRQRYGAMVFLTRSEMDGRVWEAAAFRVRFR